MAHAALSDEDAFSVASDRESLDIDRASLEADRESLYADSPTEANTQADDSSVVASTTGGQHAKSREARSISHHEQSAPFVIQDAGPAPPDYAAATAGRSAYDHFYAGHQYYGQDNAEPGSYGAVPHSSAAHGNLFSNDGVLGRNGLFSRPANGQIPQDMSDAPSQLERADERTRLLQSQDRKPTRRQSRRRRILAFCRPIKILVIFLVLCILALIIGLQLAPRRIQLPGRGKKGGATDGREGGNFHSGQPIHPSFGRCEFVASSEPRHFRFTDIKTFSLHEMFEDYRSYYPGAIRGHVWIRRAPRDQDVELQVIVSYGTTRHYRIDAADYRVEHEGLELVLPTPITVNDTDTSPACIDVGVVILVRAGLKLQRFGIQTYHMKVIADDESLFDDGFEVVRTDITGVSRAVNLSYWDSRETHISTTSADIDGFFTLRDVLTMSSSSGDVDIRVAPREADPAKPRPASLRVGTVSGTVHVTTLLDSVPARDYQTAIETNSGNINGKYISSSTGFFTTTSGSMDISLLPYATHRFYGARLNTATVSGQTWLDMLPPYQGSSDPIVLRSSHRSQSGLLRLTFPQEWEGHIEGGTTSGSIALEGKDLEVDSFYWQLPGRQIKAHKGFDGRSSTTFRTTAGDVRLRVGNP